MTWLWDLLDLFFSGERRKREAEEKKQAQIDESDRAIREELKALEAARNKDKSVN